MNDIAVVTDNLPAAPARPRFQPLASTSTQQVCTALAVAQGEFKTPKRTKPATVEGTTRDGRRYSYKYMYAPLEEIIDAVKDGLSANGLARHQYLETRGEQPIIRTIIWHASGEWIASDYPIHPTKDGAQGFASGVTYARRYGLCLALGIAPEDDDDGNVADNNPPGDTDTPSKGKSTAKKGEIQPLKEPPQVKPPEVFDPETGEVTAMKPQRVPVPVTAKGERNWPEWGGKIIAAFEAATSHEELRAWEAACTEDIQAAQQSAPNTFRRTKTAYQKAFVRLGPPADFMPVNENADPPR